MWKWLAQGTSDFTRSFSETLILGGVSWRDGKDVIRKVRRIDRFEAQQLRLFLGFGEMRNFLKFVEDVEEALGATECEVRLRKDQNFVGALIVQVDFQLRDDTRFCVTRAYSRRELDAYVCDQWLVAQFVDSARREKEKYEKN